MSQFEDVVLTVEQGIGSLTINRPERGNALRPQTLAEICEAMDILTAADDVKVILLRGEGKNFSAGADFSFLDELRSKSATEVKTQIYSHFQGAARRIYHCTKPTVAVVAGAAVTVGCELAIACDFRVAADNAFFQESWIKLGIMPPLGGTFLLPRLIGLGRASQMVLRATRVKADEALAIGLVSETVALEQLDTRARELAAELAETPPQAYAAIKLALHRGLETSMEAEWSTNVLNQAILLGSEDHAEGLEAIQEKRTPRFTGR